MEFQQRWRAIKTCWDLEVANHQFEELCDRFSKANPTWIAELRKKRQHYLPHDYLAHYLNYWTTLLFTTAVIPGGQVMVRPELVARLRAAAAPG